MVFQKGNIIWKLRKNLKDRTLMVECACGCGQLRPKYNSCGVEKKYINLHYNKLPIFRESQSEFMKKRIISDSTRNKMKKFGVKNHIYGKKKSEKSKKIHSDRMKELWLNPNSLYHLPENKNRLGLLIKGKPISDEKKKRLSKKQKELWQNEDYAKKVIKNVLKGLMKRPTSYEKKISDLCIENNLPFIYTGNGTFIIGNKNPDFKHKEQPIVIEVYNKFHHPTNYEEERGKYFIEHGYKTIFINQDEVTSKNWKNICLNKIKVGM